MAFWTSLFWLYTTDEDPRDGLADENQFWIRHLINDFWLKLHYNVDYKLETWFIMFDGNFSLKGQGIRLTRLVVSTNNISLKPLQFTNQQIIAYAATLL